MHTPLPPAGSAKAEEKAQEAAAIARGRMEAAEARWQTDAEEADAARASAATMQVRGNDFASLGVGQGGRCRPHPHGLRERLMAIISYWHFAGGGAALSQEALDTATAALDKYKATVARLTADNVVFLMRLKGAEHELSLAKADNNTLRAAAEKTEGVFFDRYAVEHLYVGVEPHWQRSVIASPRLCSRA